MLGVKVGYNLPSNFFSLIFTLIQCKFIIRNIFSLHFIFTSKNDGYKTTLLDFHLVTLTVLGDVSKLSKTGIQNLEKVRFMEYVLNHILFCMYLADGLPIM